MSDNHEKNAMSQFELGQILATLNTNVSGIKMQLLEVIRDFRSIHTDHEMRLRVQEKDSATKRDLSKVHERIDALQSRIWRVIVYLAAGGALTGGGYSVAKFLSGGS